MVAISAVASAEVARSGVNSVRKIATIETGAKGIVLPAAGSAETTMIPVAGQFAVGSPVAAAAVRETPVADGTAVSTPNVATEEDGVRKPVKAPSEPTERGHGKGVHGDARTPLQKRIANERADRPENVEAGIGINGLAVYRPRIVLGHIYNLRRRWSDLDVALILDHFLLRGGLEITGLLGAGPHDLNGLHHVLLLVVVGVAKIGGPLKILRHLVENLRERSKGLHARIPAGLRVGASGNLFRRRTTLQVQPLVGGGNLRRIRGSGEDHGDEIVGVKRDGGNHLLDVVGAEGSGSLIGPDDPLRRIVIGLLSSALLRIPLLGVALLAVRLLILRLLVLRLGVLGLLSVRPAPLGILSILLIRRVLA